VTVKKTSRLRPGLRAELTWLVTPERTAAAVGHSREVAVFATPQMGLLIELACSKAIRGKLPKDSQHVGTLLQVRHLAATPVGFRVTAKVELVKVDGRLIFRGEIFDRAGKVGEALHERAVVHWPTFEAHLEARRQGLAKRRR
jgi:predicted thioesterase